MALGFVADTDFILQKYIAKFDIFFFNFVLPKANFLLMLLFWAIQFLNNICLKYMKKIIGTTIC